MQRLIASLLVLALVGVACGSTESTDSSDSMAEGSNSMAATSSDMSTDAMADGEYLVAFFDASWCPGCQMWKEQENGPMVLAKNAEDMGVAVHMFNMEDDDTKAAGMEQATELGIQDIYNANMGTTGMALVIDMMEKTVVGEISPMMPETDSYEKQLAALKAAVGAA